MIEIGLPEVFEVLLLAAVAAAAGWAWDRRAVQSAARGVRRNSIRCRNCGAVYRWEGRENQQGCPECGRPNRRGRDRRLG